jgi:hypothetical protein
MCDLQIVAGEPPLVAEGRRLVEEASAAGVAVRLFGGVAVWLRSTPATRAALGRDYEDIDLVAHRRASREVRELLEQAGYEPQRMFNATHGATRLLFHAREGEHHVDVFLDDFRMSHELDLGARLEAESPTLPAAELLLAKLQVAEINRKDLTDAAMLLADHEPGDRDAPGRLNVAHVCEVCAADWGLYTTITDNLARLRELADELPIDGATLTARIDALAAALEDAPKTGRWRMRARIGRRKRWYETPEEVER